MHFVHSSLWAKICYKPALLIFDNVIFYKMAKCWRSEVTVTTSNSVWMPTLCLSLVIAQTVLELFESLASLRRRWRSTTIYNLRPVMSKSEYCFTGKLYVSILMQQLTKKEYITAMNVDNGGRWMSLYNKQHGWSGRRLQSNVGYSCSNSNSCCWQTELNKRSVQTSFQHSIRTHPAVAADARF